MNLIKLPRKILRNSIIWIGRKAFRIKFIYVPVERVLRAYPKIYYRIKGMIDLKYQYSTSINNNLYPWAEKLYIDLTNAINQTKG
jgi:hypothetical protein